MKQISARISHFLAESLTNWKEMKVNKCYKTVCIWRLRNSIANLINTNKGKIDLTFTPSVKGKLTATRAAKDKSTKQALSIHFKGTKKGIGSYLHMSLFDAAKLLLFAARKYTLNRNPTMSYVTSSTALQFSVWDKGNPMGPFTLPCVRYHAL